MKNKIIALLLAAIMAVSLTGCRESDVVSYNVSKEADSFDVQRRITVINARTDRVVFELEGVFALKNSVNNELTVICKTGENEYKKHFVYLNEYTLYFVEDIGGADVSSLAYEVIFYPQKIGNVVDVEMGRGD